MYTMDFCYDDIHLLEKKCDSVFESVLKMTGCKPSFPLTLCESNLIAIKKEDLSEQYYFICWCIREQSEHS